MTIVNRRIRSWPRNPIAVRQLRVSIANGYLMCRLIALLFEGSGPQECHILSMGTLVYHGCSKQQSTVDVGIRSLSNSRLPKTVCRLVIS